MLNSPDGALKAEAERKAASLALRIIARASNFEHAQYIEKGHKKYKHAKMKRAKQVSDLIIALTSSQSAM